MVDNLGWARRALSACKAWRRSYNARCRCENMVSVSFFLSRSEAGALFVRWYILSRFCVAVYGSILIQRFLPIPNSKGAFYGQSYYGTLIGNYTQSITFNDLEWPLTPILRSRHFSTLNIPETTWDRAIVTIAHQ